jgi:MFS family permease
MVVLDFFIVNVAMPAVQRDLDAGVGAIEWIVAGYGLAFAAGLVTAGRLGDQFGRRRLFGWGLAAFTLTSAACGLAPDAGLLVAARVAQGMAAALLMPQVLAIIGVAYEGRDRARAITAYAMTLGVAAVAGQLVGGALIEADLAGLGWRLCFLVNVPIGLAALAALRRTVDESRADSPSGAWPPGAGARSSRRRCSPSTRSRSGWRAWWSSSPAWPR